MRPALLSTGLALALSASACVTERVTIGPDGEPKPSTPPLQGPVARPDQDAVTTTVRVSAQITPLGTLPYDGFTLPLVTPDGRTLFTQAGSLPPWELLLAEPGAGHQHGAFIAAYDISAASAAPVAWDQSASAVEQRAGLLLGRCAGDGWCLVERQNQDGSRWIGKLAVADGSVQWLVTGPAVNSAGLLLRDGTLIYTRRAQSESANELVIQPPALGGNSTEARTLKRDGFSFFFPLLTPDQQTVAVFALGTERAEVLALSVTQVDGRGEPLLVSRFAIERATAARAFECAAPIEAAPPAAQGWLGGALLLIHPDRQRVVIWEPSKGSLTSLPAGVAAAARMSIGKVQQPGFGLGLVMASARGADFWTGAGVPTRLVAGAFIPRATGSVDEPELVLVRPDAASAAPVWQAIRVRPVSAPQSR